MPNFSPTEVLLGLATLGLSIYVLITKSAFFQGRLSVKQERDDKNDEILTRLASNVTTLLRDMEQVSAEQKLVDSRVLIVENAALIQDQRLAQMEKLFERILTQNEGIQHNLVENSKAISTLSASVDGVHSLLDNLIKGNLKL